MTALSTSKQTERLKQLIEIVSGQLSVVDEMDFNFKPAPGKWSKKEILGHLIDSAANNHQRFIRVQYENVPTIVYDQDKWNELNNYRQLESSHVINLWVIYNWHLIEVIKNIPQENLIRECNTGLDKNVTLQFLIEDYVEHMEHHLRQIIKY